jgi:hypothetical protein
VSDADDQSAVAPTDTTETNDAEVTDSPTEVEVIPTSSDDLTGDDAEMSTADPEPTPAVDTASDETVDVEPTTETDDPEVADSEATDDSASAETESDTPATLRSHVRAVIGEETGTARLLSDSFELLAEVDAEELVATLETADEAFALVFDGELTQQMLDVAAQRGLDHVVVQATGEFVKQPVGTRVLTAEQLRAAELDVEA